MYRCGALSANKLSEKIGVKNVTCVEKDRDRYGRIVAVCSAGGEDLNAWMVSEGLAVAYQTYSKDYARSRNEPSASNATCGRAHSSCRASTARTRATRRPLALRSNHHRRSRASRVAPKLEPLEPHHSDAALRITTPRSTAIKTASPASEQHGCNRDR